MNCTLCVFLPLLAESANKEKRRHLGHAAVKRCHLCFSVMSPGSELKSGTHMLYWGGVGIPVN